MSFARFARSAAQSASRRAAFAPRSVGRRGMASSAGGSSGAKGDLPWIIGSAAVFGPAFLYLISPSARKNHPAVHHDKHDYPNLKKTHDAELSHTDSVKATHEAAAPAAAVLMEDDEGTVANVGASIALAEESNVPKSDTSDSTFEQVKEAAIVEGSAESPESPESAVNVDSSAPAIEHVDIGRTDKAGSFQNPGDDGPTDMKVAEAAAQQRDQENKAWLLQDIVEEMYISDRP